MITICEICGNGISSEESECQVCGAENKQVAFNNRDYVAKRLSDAGVDVKKRKKRPKNNQHSGIIGKERGIIRINI